MSDTPMLEVRNVTKAFGSLIAVREVSLTVQRGELRAIIGPNGAGKTTFFNLISGFFPPTRGQIVFEGQDVTNLAVPERVKKGMARTFQITEVFPELTVHENVRIAVEVASGFALRPRLSGSERAGVNRALDQLLERTRITDKASRLVGELAHGDQRIVEIAGLIRRLHRDENYSIVLVEHDMRLVFHLADRITVLAEGALLADGTPSDIAANPDVQAAYLGHAA